MSDGEWDRAIGLLHTPLLAVVCALSTGGAALVTGVTGDTVRLVSEGV